MSLSNHAVGPVLPSEVYRILNSPDTLLYPRDLIKQFMVFLEPKIEMGLEYYNTTPTDKTASDFKKIIGASKDITSSHQMITFTLSKLLNLSEIKAHEIVNEYRRSKVVFLHNNSEEVNDPLSMCVDIRYFYFRQRLSLLKTIRLILLQEHNPCYTYSREVKSLIPKIVGTVESPAGTIVSSLNTLLDWNSADWRNFDVLNKDECYLDLSARSAALISENHVIWSKQIVAEFEVLLEIVLLLSKRQKDDPGSIFDRCDLLPLLEKARDSGFSLPKYPLQRLYALTPYSTTNLDKCINCLEKRVQFLWVTFVISLCKFPYVMRCLRCEEQVRHPLINLVEPYQISRLKLPDYLSSLERMVEDNDERLSMWKSRGQFKPAPLIFFSLMYFLKLVKMNGKASIDNTYLGILCEDFVEKLNTIALDSLVYLLGPRANLTADVKDNHLDVIRNLVFILARDTDRGTGCFNEENNTLSPRIDKYSELLPWVLKGRAYNELIPEDRHCLKRIVEARMIDTYKPLIMFRILSAMVMDDDDFVFDVLQRPVQLSTIEESGIFVSYALYDKFCPPVGDSSHFIASKLSGCPAQIAFCQQFGQVYQAKVVWDYDVTYWRLLLESIVSSVCRDLEIWNETGENLLSSLILLRNTLCKNNEWVFDQCKLYAIADKPFYLIIDPILTLVEHFVSILVAEKSTEPHLTLFVELLEVLLELMKIVVCASEIVSEIISRFGYGDKSLAEQLYMIIIRNKPSAVGPQVAVTVTKFMATLVRALRTPPDTNYLRIKNIFDEMDMDGNGRIDKVELREGLQKMGYSVSQTTADTLHARMDQQRTGSIHFSDLITFASREEDHVPETEVELAMSELQSQLSDCFIPGGRAAYKSAVVFGETSVEFALQLLGSINHWHFAQQGIKNSVTINILSMIASLLEHSPLTDSGYSFSLHASSYLVRRIQDDIKNGIYLVQTALMDGLRAVHRHVNLERDAAIKMGGSGSSGGVGLFKASGKGDMYIAGQRSATDQILPIDFPSVHIDDEISQTLVTVSALHVLDLLIDFLSHHCKHLVPIFIGLFLTHADLPRGSILTYTGSILSSQTSTSDVRLPCPYLPVLAGYITKSVVGPRPNPDVDVLSIKLLSKLLSCPIDLYPQSSATGVQTSLLSTMGISNMQLFVSTILEILNLSQESQELRSSILDFFSSLVAYHSDTFAYLLEELTNLDVKTPCEAACLELKLAVEDKEKIYTSGVFDEKLVELVTKKLNPKDTLINKERVKNVLKKERVNMKFLLSKESRAQQIAGRAFIRESDRERLSAENSLVLTQIFGPLYMKGKDETSMLYQTEPLLFFKITQILLILLDKLSNSSINRAIVHVLQSKAFWTEITCPLFQNLQANSVADGEEAVVLYCQQLMCHAAVLELLASEQYGVGVQLIEPTKKWRPGRVTQVSKGYVNILLDEDNSLIKYVVPHLIRRRLEGNPVEEGDLIEYCTLHADKTIEKLVDNFLERANKNHRFNVWLHGARDGAHEGRSYMDVEYDQESINDMQSTCERLGVQVKDLLTVSSSNSDTFTNSEYQRWSRISKFGSKYVFDTDGIFSPADKDLWSDSSEIVDLVKMVNSNNLKLSLADAQLCLFKNWRKFIEVFIFPGALLLQREIDVSSPSPRSPSRSRSDSMEAAGRFSPQTMIKDDNPPSPGSKIASSSFVGDKRSYELMNCLVVHFNDYAAKRNIFAVDLEVIEEKSRLFLAMLHHQIKEVRARTKDPARAESAMRSGTNNRLGGEKIELFLTSLEHVFTAYNTGSTRVSPPLGLIRGPLASVDLLAHKKSSVDKSLLSSVLLLVSNPQFHSWEPEDPARRRNFLACKQKWMVHTIKCIHSEMGKNEIAFRNGGCNSGNSKSISSHNPSGKRDRESCRVSPDMDTALKSSLIKIRLALQIITQLILTGTTPGLFTTQMAGIVISLLQSFSCYSASYVNCYADYTHWPNVKPIGAGDPCELEIPVSSDVSVCPVSVELTVNCICDILDLVTSACMASDTSLIDALFSSGFLQEMSSSTLLVNFQDLLKNQDRDRARVFMYYNARNGETSEICEIWCRCLSLMDRILELSSSNPIDSAFNNSIDMLFKFLCKFEYLMYLPLFHSPHRLSLGMIHLSTKSADLFVKLNVKLGSCMSIYMSRLFELFSRDCLNILKDTVPLLGVGDEKDIGADLMIRARLHGHFVAISKSDKLEEHSLRKKTMKVRRMKKFKQFAHVLGSLKTEASKTASMETRTATFGGGGGGGGGDDEWSHSEDKSYPMMHFLLDAEAALLEMLIPVTLFVHNILPNILYSINVSVPDPGEFYSVGSQVVYHSRTQSMGSGSNIHKGQIISIGYFQGSKMYSMLIPETGMVDDDILLGDILYPEEPLIVHIENQKWLDGDREHMEEFRRQPCSTYILIFLVEYLMKSNLHVKMKDIFTEEWVGCHMVETNMKLLAEQVIAILIQTLAHHTVKVKFSPVESQYTEQIMENLLKMCGNIQDIIKFKSNLLKNGDIDSGESSSSISLYSRGNTGTTKLRMEKDGFFDFVQVAAGFLNRLLDEVNAFLNRIEDVANISDFCDDETVTWSGGNRSRSTSMSSSNRVRGNSSVGLDLTRSPKPVGSPSTGGSRSRLPSKSKGNGLSTPRGIKSIRSKAEYLD